MLLTDDPKDNPDITTYYLGWDASGNPGTGGVGIHHPRGDIKKISTYSISPFDSYCASSDKFWDVRFINTTNGHGIVEHQSSGSALINNERRVIGQLKGPTNILKCPSYNCDNPSLLQVAYGKFSASWMGNLGSVANRRLKDWLDPVNTGVSVLDGSQCIDINFTNQTVTANTTVTNCCNINVQDVTVTNNAILILDAVKETTIDGNFEVQLGSGLEIK